jgi:Na+/melibiose symporter-like transporter
MSMSGRHGYRLVTDICRISVVVNLPDEQAEVPNRLQAAGAVLSGAVVRSLLVAVAVCLGLYAYRVNAPAQSNEMLPGLEWLFVAPAVLVLLAAFDFAVSGFHKAMRAWTALAVLGYIALHTVLFFLGADEPAQIARIAFSFVVTPVALGAIVAWPIRRAGIHSLNAKAAPLPES